MVSSKAFVSKNPVPCFVIQDIRRCRFGKAIPGDWIVGDAGGEVAAVVETVFCCVMLGGSVSTLTLPSGREALEPLEERSLRALSPFAAFPSLERLLLTLDDSRSPDVCFQVMQGPSGIASTP